MAKLLSIKFIIGLLAVLCLANTISALDFDGDCFYFVSTDHTIGCTDNTLFGCQYLANKNKLGQSYCKK